MDRCDVLIVGGGPAGSSCAYRLRHSGLKVVVVDRALFPRDKPCAGWVTPRVFDLLGISPEEYAAGRTLQPIRRFLTGLIGGHAIETDYHTAVSWGVRRCEFDRYLLARAGCRVLEGTTVLTLLRGSGRWVCNGDMEAAVVVGAGGHFCPVARTTNAPDDPETLIAAQEAEFPLPETATRQLEADRPELYFCRDLQGYGWCFRKGAHLNIGLGRVDPHGLSRHVHEFLDWLRSERGVPVASAVPLRGHAYLLRGASRRRFVDDGLLLAGDAAGLAAPRSGEGIRTAVESGILAAETILECGGDFRKERLQEYTRKLTTALGPIRINEAVTAPPGRLSLALGTRLLASAWFTRKVLLDRWFLGASSPCHESRPNVDRLG